MKALVAVVGRRVTPPTEDLDSAREVGRQLAEADYGVVTGGRGGIMEAAQRGAIAAGGVVIAIVPLEEHPVGPATVVIRTGLTPQLRNVVTATTCDAMVALPGSHGTWQEMAVGLDRGVPVLAIGHHSETLPGTEEVSLRDLIQTLHWLLSPTFAT